MYRANQNMDRVNFVIVFLTVITILIPSVQNQRPSQSPCYFNPLCTCSKTVPSFGVVSCIDVTLPRIPTSFNFSKMSGLNLEHNNLRAIENHTFSTMGLITLRIKDNPIHIIPREIFNGLEVSLRELELRELNLISVPSQALSRLKKLHVLNLSGNEISEINSYNWLGVEDTVETLILNNNAIIRISRGVFGGFKKLKYLDLSENLIAELPTSLFHPGLSGQLMHLYLNDNRLQHIPYQQLQEIRLLNTLNLSYNFITNIAETSEYSTAIRKLSINLLRLDYNRIRVLVGGAFAHFESLDALYLDGNQIDTIRPDSFYNIPISELSLVKCSLKSIVENTFQGLDKYLRSLDLSDNDLFIFPYYFLSNFDNLKTLIIRNNPLETVSSVLPEVDSSLEKLDILGHFNIHCNINAFSRMKKLRSLSVSKCRIRVLSPQDFYNFGSNLEELYITNADLESVNSHTFFHISRIVKLDLSYNAISDIHPDAFMEIGHSLEYLRLSAAFSLLRMVPVEIFKHLVNLKFLDLSYNKFEVLHEVTLHSLTRLRTIHLQDCQIRVLHRNTLQGNIHTELRNVLFSYNFLKIISSNTFADLKELRRINLEDNQITKIERYGFINLENVRTILLRGNRISVIENESFQNLPNLELLDLAYNELVYFDFVVFDQVGMMAITSLNISFNRIHSLGRDIIGDFNLDTVHNGNIEIMDVSHNNITDISPGYFRTVQSSLIYFYASWNLLWNVTCHFFNDLHQLQLLDLSYNRIFNIDFCSFRRVRKLQVLYLNHNLLQDLQASLFSGMIHMRILDLSYNKLKLLPDYLLKEDSLQYVSFAHNQLLRIPFKSFTEEGAKYLCTLNISHNSISSISSPALFAKFEMLTTLDLSTNDISRLADSSFKYLTKLVHLDLSHNHRMDISDNSFIFNGLENSLQTVHLRNMRLKMVPNLALPTLLHLYLNENNIFDIDPELASNITSLRTLDIRCNSFANIPITILSFPDLKNLFIAANNITVLVNTSLLSGLPFIRTLDISDIPLNVLEVGVLNKLQSLRRLRINLSYRLEDFNVPMIINDNTALRDLHILADDYVLEKQLFGKFPPKLRAIYIMGPTLETIKTDIFEEISVPEFSLTLTNTSVEILPRNLIYRSGNLNYLNLDLRNNKLSHISRYVLGKFTYDQLFNIYLSGNRLICDCEIGWIGIWNRKRRQNICGPYENDDQESCYNTNDDFRLLSCFNDKEKYLLNELKDDLKCAWNLSSKTASSFSKLLLIITTFLYINILNFEYLNL